MEYYLHNIYASWNALQFDCKIDVIKFVSFDAVSLIIKSENATFKLLFSHFFVVPQKVFENLLRHHKEVWK